MPAPLSRPSMEKWQSLVHFIHRLIEVEKAFFVLFLLLFWQQQQKNNRWIKSFNYPCEGRADTECVCVCVWYNSPHTIWGQRSGCHGSSDWGLEKVGRRGREQTVGKGRREIQKQMDEGEKRKKISPSSVPHARMRVVSVTRWAYSKFVLPNAGSKGQAWTSDPKALARTETCSRFSEKADMLTAQ